MGLLKHKHLQGLTRLTVYTLVHSGKIARGCSFKKIFFFKTADTVFFLNTPSLTFILLARGCSVCHFLKSKLLIQFFSSNSNSYIAKYCFHNDTNNFF